MLRTHIQSGHIKVNGVVVVENAKKIIPDSEFLTHHTKDLAEILKNIPKESLYTGEDEY